MSKFSMQRTGSEFSSPLVWLSQPLLKRHMHEFASCKQPPANRKLFVTSLALEKCQAQLILFNKAFGLPLMNKKGQRLETYVES